MLLILGLAASGAATARADPTPAEGYRMEIVRKSGAIFAGLASDGDTLLLTDLAEGRLYRRAADGAFQAFGPQLPHGADVMGDPTGPYRVARFGAGYLVAQGWTPADRLEDPRDHALLAVDETGVTRILHRDFWNPFDFVIDGEAIYVVDSGHNTVERLAADGAKTTLFAFPRLKQQAQALESLSPTEFAGKKPYEVDAVPTGIDDQDGRLWVSLFGGFPYIEGGGVVVSLDKAGPNTSAHLEVEGLDTPVAIAFDRHGRLLVLEHGRFDQASGFVAGSGRLVAIDAGKESRRVILDGLTRPASVLVRGDGRIVVSELGGTLLFLTEVDAP
jgi:sugar lactone lactonase YvrE